MNEMVARIAALQDYESYRDLHWEGSFEDYLQIVRERPQVTRNAFQRLYDMIVAAGQEEYLDNKKKIIRYHFFRDDSGRGRDAIYGLDIPLQRLANVLKAAFEEHDCPALEKGHRGVLPHARRRAVHL
jgi:serine protein kinase